MFALHASAETTDRVVTVPMALELGRPYIDLRLTGPSHVPVLAQAWLDTGGSSFLLSAGLARRLGLRPTSQPTQQQAGLSARTTMPAIAIGSMTVTPRAVTVVIIGDASEKLPHSDAEAAVPMRMLRDYHVVFDYAERRLTIATPGTLAPMGERVAGFIGPSGLPVVLAMIDGKAWPFLLDTGATYTMISQAVHDLLTEAHADWPRASPAYGPANMLASDTDCTMLGLNTLELGASTVREVGTVSRAARFFEWLSRNAGAPVVGALGGNALTAFRIDIDYPAGRIYLAQTGKPASPHADMVPITLGTGPDGYVIAAVDSRASGLAVGDVILSVGNVKARSAALATMILALCGEVGETRTLTIRRGSRTLTVSAVVVRIL
jgi:hypothetical protein